jgi:predicted unusual protein kinase regulating ubiquinone biosynthesis (AarF/ABC1/UbiB family)
MWRYTTRRVLVTEWVDGKSPSQLLAAADAPLPLGGASAASGAAEDERQRQARRQVLSLVRMGVQCSLAQLLVTGVMHGDPHSGNLLLRKVRLAQRCWSRAGRSSSSTQAASGMVGGF